MWNTGACARRFSMCTRNFLLATGVASRVIRQRSGGSRDAVGHPVGNVVHEFLQMRHPAWLREWRPDALLLQLRDVVVFFHGGSPASVVTFHDFAEVLPRDGFVREARADDQLHL